jgi:hypothetical protein
MEELGSGVLYAVRAIATWRNNKITVGRIVFYAAVPRIYNDEELRLRDSLAADTHLMKLQRLQNRILRAIGYLERRTPVRDLHLVFKIPYVYDYVTKLCRRQAEVILTYENPNVRAIGQGEAKHRKHKRLKLGGGQAYDRSSVCRFWGLNKLRHRLLHNPALTEVPVYIRTKCQVIFC